MFPYCTCPCVMGDILSYPCRLGNAVSEWTCEQWDTGDIYAFSFLFLDRIYRINRIFWSFSLPGKKGENTIHLRRVRVFTFLQPEQVMHNFFLTIHQVCRQPGQDQHQEQHQRLPRLFAILLGFYWGASECRGRDQGKTRGSHLKF